MCVPCLECGLLAKLNNYHLDKFQLVWYRVNLDNNRAKLLGRGGGQVVSVHAFYSDSLSSNPSDVYNFL